MCGCFNSLTLPKSEGGERGHSVFNPLLRIPATSLTADPQEGWLCPRRGTPSSPHRHPRAGRQRGLLRPRQGLFWGEPENLTGPLPQTPFHVITKLCKCSPRSPSPGGHQQPAAPWHSNFGQRCLAFLKLSFYVYCFQGIIMYRDTFLFFKAGTSVGKAHPRGLCK